MTPALILATPVAEAPHLLDGNTAPGVDWPDHVIREHPDRTEAEILFRNLNYAILRAIYRVFDALRIRPSWEIIRLSVEDPETLFWLYCALWLAGREPDWLDQVSPCAASLDMSRVPFHLRHRPPLIAVLIQWLRCRKFGDPVAEEFHASVLVIAPDAYHRLVAGLLPLIGDRSPSGRAAA